MNFMEKYDKIMDRLTELRERELFGDGLTNEERRLLKYYDSFIKTKMFEQKKILEPSKHHFEDFQVGDYVKISKKTAPCGFYNGHCGIVSKIKHLTGCIDVSFYIRSDNTWFDFVYTMKYCDLEKIGREDYEKFYKRINCWKVFTKNI